MRLKSEDQKLKCKYNNLLTESKKMCHKFTGPHSVLQIFLEKIVASISFISEQLKEMTLKEIGLWNEIKIPIQEKEQVKTQTKGTGSSSVLIGHKRSSSADTNLKSAASGQSSGVPGNAIN